MEDLSCKFLDGGYTVGTRGTIKPCCVMRGVPNQPFWENKHHQEVDWWKEVKSDLESGIRHPYCYPCWNLEAVGERSTRNHGNDWFVKDWIGPITPWTWVDLKLGNLCNLQCRMCHAGNSTQIAKEIDNTLHILNISMNLITLVTQQDNDHTRKNDDIVKKRKRC